MYALTNESLPEQILFNTERPVVLVSAADGRFVMPMTVALHSALCNLDPGDPVIVYILADGICDQDRAHSLAVLQRAHPRVAVRWLAPDIPDARTFPEKLWHSRATYLRLLVPSVLPDRIGRALYLDADTVVCRDLAPLWSVDMRGHSVMAVEGWGHATLGVAIPQLMHLVGAPADKPYFNSGVMLMDLHRWREQRIVERTLDFLQAHKDLIVWADQDPLNAVLAGEWGQLDLSYNVQIATLHHPKGVNERDRERYLQAASDPAILHYTWKRKPWHWRYSGPKNDAFLRAAIKSGWFAPLEGQTWQASRALSHLAYRRAVSVKQLARA
ncbi:glycosyltransferase family 8 protein [Microvirga roseola]|uniref:glycosyltransferase family 8 protein n=1 Tax=Microvirga roseola TaxID=2883126 RepID=UPI0022A86533|nr:glycosyltransferase family 8 protein [Microvirga roseola]